MNTDSTASAAIICSIAPWLIVRNGAAAVVFYKAAFGALELHHVEDPTGAVVSRLSVSGAEFWLSGESAAEDGSYGPETTDEGTVRMILTVPDPDTLLAQALAAGAREIYPLSVGHGWRICRIADPFGHHWEIGHPIATD